MTNSNAIITAVASYLPDYVLTNEELSTMVDTTDEWIMTRVGIKERRILKEGATSDMATKAVQRLLEKRGIGADEVDLVICATSSGDYRFPATAAVVADKVGIKNALGFDVQAACSGFLVSLQTAAAYVKSGLYKKVVVVAAEKMSSMTDYTDRTTCPLFGDAAAAVMLEPSDEPFGYMDAIIHMDGFGREMLKMKAGGSARPASYETIDNHEHCVYQEGKTVFKYAVSFMADTAVELMKRNNLKKEDIAWFVPHQANMRIIDAAQQRIGLPREQVMINIDKVGNTSAASLPLCLAQWESSLKKGDNLILAAFGSGFIWGALYLKWAYDPK